MAGSLVPKTNFGAQLAELGQSLYEQQSLREAADLYEKQLSSALGAQGQAAAGGALAPLGQSAPQRSFLPLGAAQGGFGDYLATVRGKESGGDDTAKNPSSTATGRYQFTAETWAGLSRRHPELGLTPGGRTDPDQQERAMQQFTRNNAEALSASGAPITPGNLYVSHFLGEAGGPRFIRGAMQQPDAPATAFVSPGAAAANRSIFYNPDGSPKSAGAVYAERTSRFGGAPAAGQAAPVRVAVGSNPGAPQVPTPQAPARAVAMPAQDQAAAEPDAANMPAPNAVPTGFRIPGEAAPSDFVPGTVASPPVSGSPQAPAAPGLTAAAAPRLTQDQANNLRAMLRNPVTQAHAAKIIEGLNKPSEFSFQVVGDQLIRTSKDGRAEVVPNITKPPTFSVVKGSDNNDYILNPQTGSLTRAVQGKDERFVDVVDPAERAAAGVDPGYKGAVQRGPDNKLVAPFKPSTEVNIDQKGETAFAQTANKGIADRFLKISEEGDAGRTDMALLGQLRGLGDQVGTGAKAAIQGYLAEKGIKLGDNVGSVEAYGALIDRLTPAQRIPGAGATSDFDARMFKGSLPRLINTPEGNALIVSTLEALAQDRVARAALAEKGLTGEMKPQDVVKALRALPSPNLTFKDGLSQLQRSGRLGAEAPAQQSAPRQADQAAPAAPRVGAVMRGYRYKGGDPASQSSWEPAQ